MFHLRPPAQWMNDVHGAFFHRGWYHVFFQFHPGSDECGQNGTGRGIGWGHARSRDLVRWEVLPPALLPDPRRHEKSLASGSSFVRADGVPMLFFTLTPEGMPGNKREAWGALPQDDDDELVNWRRVDLGLRAGESGVPRDIKAIWADMFVFRHGTRVFATFKESEGMVCQAQNEDLCIWKKVGNLGGIGGHVGAGEAGVAGECPNLFTLGGRQVLIRSTYPISYLIGSFTVDPVGFRVTSGPHVLDHAYGGQELPGTFMRGLYGTTVFSDPGGRTILLGWISGFRTGSGWNGCMSVPRVLRIEGDRLRQQPLPELAGLRRSHRRVSGARIEPGLLRIEAPATDNLEIAAELDPGTAAGVGLIIRGDVSGTRGLRIRHAGGVLDVAGTQLPCPLEPGETLRLRVFHDRCVLEVFAQEGAHSVSRVSYARQGDLQVFAFAEAGTAILRSLDAWDLEAVW